MARIEAGTGDSKGHRADAIDCGTVTMLNGLLNAPN